VEEESKQEDDAHAELADDPATATKDEVAAPVENQEVPQEEKADEVDTATDAAK
jgi:hypothetical protein